MFKYCALKCYFPTEKLELKCVFEEFRVEFAFCVVNVCQLDTFLKK